MTASITLSHEKQSVHVNAIREEIDSTIDETLAVPQKVVKFQDRITHVNHVKEVLRRLRKFDLYVNLKKCEFFVKKVEYLRFIVSVDDIKMN